METTRTLFGTISDIDQLYGVLREKENLKASLSSLVTEIIEKNYDNLDNKPKINGVELDGDKNSSDLKISEVIKAQNYLYFPNIGKENCIYIDITNNKTYRWDNVYLKYYVVGSDYNDIKIINGGDAFG